MKPALPAHWIDVDLSLQRDYDFASFKDCMRYMMAVAEHCETVNHHPEWTNVGEQLSVRLSTHDLDKVTEKDYALATVMERLFQEGYAKKS